MTLPVLARGVAKTLAVLAETSYGVQPTGTAQLLRRNQSMINYQIQQIDSQEILPSEQRRDSRQGARTVSGQIMAQLSCLTYESLMANLFRSSFAAGVSLTGIAASTLAIGASAVTLTASGSNFLTAGFKIGDVVTLSGLVAPAAVNNGIYMPIIGLTATVMTLALPANGATLTAYTTGQTALGVAVVGKKLTMPNSVSGATIGSLAFEHWYSDIGYSELTLGTRITSMGFSVPASGIVGLNIGFSGRQILTSNTEQFPAPAAATTTELLTASGGTLILYGQPIAYVTSVNFQISAAADSPPVVGTPYTPNIFVGTLSVSGSLQLLMANDATFADLINEAELQMQVYLTDSPSANAPNFISVFFPRIKIFSDNKNDTDREIVRSVNFVALEQSVLGGTGTAYDDTTITIQDSLAV